MAENSTGKKKALLEGELLLPEVLKAASQVARICGTTDNDLGYYQAIYPDILLERTSLISSKLLALTKSIASAASGPSSFSLDKPSSEMYEDVLVDVLDGMLEECDHQLDIHHGRIKEPKIQVRQPQQKRARFQTAPAHLTVIKPDNIDIYEPTIHPYTELINSLSYEKYLCPSDEEILPIKGLDETPLIWVDTEASLKTMIEDLLREPVIAVDLEHHSMHSFHGITCLIQISSPSTDYLIDAIRLRSQLPSLSSILSNPAILKVMHGSESDNSWLQRDFNLFLVNLFDTFFAAKALNLERFSFAHLVKEYAGLEIDKQHQMSDWRIRPLPEDMQLYARIDTHYLLRIFEHVRRELLGKSKETLIGVFNRSAAQCLRLFKVETSRPTDWKAVIAGSNVPFNKTELARVKAVYEWRDQVAKLEDVSQHALLPNPMIIRIAQTSPNADLEAVLKASRFDLRLVIKNMSSLKEVLEKSAVTGSKPNKPMPEPASKPEHIIFRDEDDHSSVFEPAKHVVVATELRAKNKQKRSGVSLAGAFATNSVARPTLDMAPVIAKLDLTKVEKAASMLQDTMKEKVSEEAVEHEVEVEEPKAKKAVVMKTGETIDEATILENSTNKFELNFVTSSSKSKQATASKVEPFDYSTATLEQGELDIANTIPKANPVSHVAKEFKPVIESAVFPKSNAGPRIPTQPRSGNRNRTFYD